MKQLVVAIPVKDEAALIGDCLRALALQSGRYEADVLLLVNNSTDGTAEIARALRPTLPCRVHVIEHSFAPGQADAGHARGLAMSRAAALAGPDGVLLTTDADSCVPPDWLAANVAALQAGADVVCGRAAIDPLDALRIPQHLHDDDVLEVAFAGLLDRIACVLDPDVADPWPRHGEESGASIAVRCEAFLAAGGVPPMRSGEDRALLGALRRIDARIRHAPEIVVSVSGRTAGRAADGMADTIRRRIQRQDPVLDDALEPVDDRVRRLTIRRAMRLAWRCSADRAHAAARLAGQLGLSLGQLEGWLDLSCFGAAWSLAEAASPVLGRRRVPRCEVGEQIASAEAVLAAVALAAR